MAGRPRSGGRGGRRGSAFAHRYHSRELASPLEVKRALSYVIHNGRKHHPPRCFGSPKPARLARAVIICALRPAPFALLLAFW